jgi:phosphoglycerate dehydrogenase-like enzyme
MTVVCLPDEQARELVGEVAGLTMLAWDGTEAAPPRLADTELLVASYTQPVLSAGQLASMPRLRVLQVLTAGVDGWLSVLPPGVTLCNGRGVHGPSTAEIAVALVLAQVRELARYARQQAAQIWFDGPRNSICDQRVMVIGAGDIGSRVGRSLAALGAEVTLVGRAERPERPGVRSVDAVAALLPEQDVVVLAVPLTPQTEGLVDAGFLSRLKDHAVVVNVGRGATIVTEALLSELESGRLRAGLDVTDPEPLPVGHPLWDAPNLLLTPHVGGGSTGSPRRAYTLVADQLQRFVAGEPLLNVVTGR